MTRPVLFLDIDGVLNSEAWMISRGKMADWPPSPEGKQAYLRWHAELQLDPAAVERLNRLVGLAQCDVVLSSAWRHGDQGLAETQFELAHRGFRHRLVDRTPDCAQMMDSGIFVGAERGAEIAEWLGKNPEVKTFAIVDDSADMGPLIDRLVRTDWKTGLLDEHVERLVAMLKEDA